jgi:hypothetical protein
MIINFFHSCMQITKREVDRFKKGKRIPSCLLLAKYEGETVSDLVHPVKLNGTRDPYDNLIIRVSGKNSLNLTVSSPDLTSTDNCITRTVSSNIATLFCTLE